ncbi:unnamed protein product [Clonostachys byssicola]|uniref:NAD(P)-binding protein n=1 Tax=Clonostachys byssicola TaxID=160290 RepID=A0A9N9U4W1_9HYPO|nr:unnamed protein product [Clonostachys byssicola]
MSIGVALLGGGIFAREEHFPAIQATKKLTLKAVYSRSLKSAKTVCEDSNEVQLYSDDSAPGRQLSDVLTRDDVHAVIVALPILVQPAVIKKALLAGKHVLSEKPIAKDLTEAQELISWYEKNIDSSKVTWGIAENFRYLSPFLKTREVIQGLGRPLGFRVRMQTFNEVGGKFYETEWRKKPEYQGGFLLDGGVHFTAGLRLLLGQDKITSVSAYTNQLQAHLPPVDTADAILRTESGVTGTFSVSFGTSFGGNEWTVACEKGVASFGDGVIKVTKPDGQADTVEYENSGNGVTNEVRAWAASIVNKNQDWQQRPKEALADLEIVSYGQLGCVFAILLRFLC